MALEKLKKNKGAEFEWTLQVMVWADGASEVLCFYRCVVEVSVRLSAAA
jgi:hypothetical protein